jgi:hypothetical protein
MLALIPPLAGHSKKDGSIATPVATKEYGQCTPKIIIVDKGFWEMLN